MGIEVYKDQVFVGTNFTLRDNNEKEEPRQSKLPILSEEVVAKKIKEIRMRQKDLRTVKSRGGESRRRLPKPKNHFPDPRSNFESLRVLSPRSRKRLKEAKLKLRNRQRIERERNNIELFNGVSVVQIKPQLQKKTVKTSVDVPGFEEIRSSRPTSVQAPVNIASIEDSAAKPQRQQ